MTKTKFSNTKNRSLLFAGAAASLALSATCHAQSSDALIDKLVDKGILTANEARDLREEADKDFKNAIAAKTGMPDWVSGYKISGDVRGRFEGFYAENQNAIDRNRLRYRVRAGITISMLDSLEAGFKISSGESGSGGSNNEGDPISGNTTMQNNGSKKLIYIDQAYGKWTPFTGVFSGGFTVGKMENPLVLSDLIMDQDYTPEGIAGQFAYQLNNNHSLKLNAAGFVLDEVSSHEKDPWMIATQVRWDAKWNDKWSSSLGAAYLPLISRTSLTTSAVPAINRGNSRNADGTLAYHFNPIDLDASLTYNFDKAPFYSGPFPVKLTGEYVINPGAPDNADNYAWSAGITFGKAGKKKTWEVGYAYKWLGGNSAWEELTDSDFGAYYGAANSPANSGAGIGYGSGPNVKGHVVKFAYSPADSLTVSLKWIATDLINEYPENSQSGMNRMQVDAVWKF